MTSYRGYDDQDQTEGFAAPESYNEHHPETREFPPAGEYQDSQDYDIYNDDYQSSYIHLAYENLPFDQKSNDHWVARVAYEDLYDNTDRLGQENSELYRLYSTAVQLNENLKNEAYELREENNALTIRANSASSKTDARERVLREREDALESRQKRDKIVRYSLTALSALSLILFFVFLILWVDLRNDTTAVGNNNEVRQEQLTNLRNSLESERQAKNDAVTRQSELQTQLDDATKRLEDTTKSLEDANRQLQDSEKRLEDLTGTVDELERQGVETVTVTETQQVPGDAVTITTTVTEPAASIPGIPSAVQ